ncbi:type II toxin-antitoxin system RelE/ParE family toxin [Prosthecomicrobium sp. N25]|uniref:type II toxin-antitoxin system RelE/ParE family toxin n=1 Tax=Prosthecomicrobium sp. N25 TaxID=3129254 RepID=UPI003078555D
MVDLVFSNQARRDLLEIWEWIAQEDETLAEKVMAELEASCLRLTRFPELGRPRPDLWEGSRSILVKRWIVVYRREGPDILIQRVVSPSRDLQKLRWDLP